MFANIEVSLQKSRKITKETAELIITRSARKIKSMEVEDEEIDVTTLDENELALRNSIRNSPQKPQTPTCELDFNDPETNDNPGDILAGEALLGLMNAKLAEPLKTLKQKKQKRKSEEEEVEEVEKPSKRATRGKNALDNGDLKRTLRSSSKKELPINELTEDKRMTRSSTKRDDFLDVKRETRSSRIEKANQLPYGSWSPVQDKEPSRVSPRTRQSLEVTLEAFKDNSESDSSTGEKQRRYSPRLGRMDIKDLLNDEETLPENGISSPTIATASAESSPSIKGAYSCACGMTFSMSQAKAGHCKKCPIYKEQKKQALTEEPGKAQKESRVSSKSPEPIAKSTTQNGKQQKHVTSNSGDFKAGDLVWARYRNSWWAAKICDESTLEKEVLSEKPRLLYDEKCIMWYGYDEPTYGWNGDLIHFTSTSRNQFSHGKPGTLRYKGIKEALSELLGEENDPFNEGDESDSSEYDAQDVCAECRKHGNLLICDLCALSFHLKCLDPPLDVVPQGEWFCSECATRAKSIKKEATTGNDERESLSKRRRKRNPQFSEQETNGITKVKEEQNGDKHPPKLEPVKVDTPAEMQIEKKPPPPIVKKVPRKSTVKQEITEVEFYDSDRSDEDSDSDRPKKKRKKQLKKKSSDSGRINRPRLGEIPEVEHKKVYCKNRTGRIVGDSIVCDHCQEKMGVSQFEQHAGLLTARNPYKTIFVVESGKCLNDYRNCMYCHTTETPVWRKGPYGERTLCNSCGQKWEQKEIGEIVFSKIIDSSKGAECRAKEPNPAKSFKPTDAHAPNVKPVKTIPFKEMTLELFEEYVMKKKEPIVLTNANEGLNSSIWSFEYLKTKHSNEEVAVRYMELDNNDESQFETVKDSTKKMGWFLDNAEIENNQNDEDFDPQCVPVGKRSVMYAKDFSFSEKIPEWLKDLKPLLPEYLVPYGKHDLMGYLDEPVRPIVWMAYMGSGGTRTPLHLDKIASMAINLHAIGEGTKLWWLMDHNKTPELEEHLKKHDGCLWRDSYWMAPVELEATGIDMWFHEQKRGDLMLVPPLVPHTVINHGSLSCAVAANVLNDHIIQNSWEREKVNRTINRTSIYRLKPTVYATVMKICAQEIIRDIDIERLKRVVPVWKDIVAEEETEKEAKLTEDGWFICDGCGTDIFNKRYHCGSCRAGDYDLCIQCYEKFGKDHFHQMDLLEKYPNQQLKSLLQQAANLIGVSL